MELKVEVGFKLEKDFKYYDKMLIQHGLKKVFCCFTHDVYYTKEKSFDGLTENEIKNKCIRLRYADKSSDNKEEVIDIEKENLLISKGYIKIFDTYKKDCHYISKKINGCVQLQEIDNLGLVVYYDNPDYYGLNLEEQRNLLIKDLNIFGFSFKESDLGIDKLRTFYYKKEMFSKNQNG